MTERCPLVVRALTGCSGPVRCRADDDCGVRSLGPTDWRLQLEGQAPIPFPTHAYKLRRGTRYYAVPGTGAMVLMIQLLTLP